MKALSGKYVTLEQWAKATGISLPTARRRAAEGDPGVFVKMGRIWIVKAEQ